MHTQIYLFFDGRTEEALDFYKKTLGIEVGMLMRFKDAPPEARQGMAPGSENKVMHSAFKLGDQQVMASDGHCGSQPEFKGFSLSLAVKDEAEAEKVFNALGAGFGEQGDAFRLQTGRPAGDGFRWPLRQPA